MIGLFQYCLFFPEMMMYNRVYSHITKHLVLYEKQFGFQKQCSTEHAILQLTKEIYESFDKIKITLGVFVDLSKAFDTVNNEIVISKNYHIMELIVHILTGLKVILQTENNI